MEHSATGGYPRPSSRRFYRVYSGGIGVSLTQEQFTRQISDAGLELDVLYFPSPDATNDRLHATVCGCHTKDELEQWAESQNFHVDDVLNGFTILAMPVDGAESPILDVITVPGLKSHPIGSFKGHDGYLWIRDSLIRLDPYKRARIMAYGYHSEIEGNSLHNLSHIAQNFTNDLRIARTLNPRRPLIVIAHSLGGIVVKQAMCDWKDNGKHELLTSIQGLFFFGVPNKGMERAATGPLWEIARDEPTRFLVGILEKGHETLPRLHRNFMRLWLAEGVCQGVPIYSYFEKRLSRVVKKVNGCIQETDDMAVLVDDTSATHEWSPETADIHCNPILKDHRQLVKFSRGEFFESPDFGRVLDGLVHVGQRAESAYQRRSPMAVFDSLVSQPRRYSRLPQCDDYLNHVVPEAYEQYRYVYEHLSGNRNHITLADLDDQVFRGKQQRTLRDNWNIIRRDKTEIPWEDVQLNRHLTMSLLYMIHMDLIKIKTKKPNRLDEATYRRVERFDDWVSCQCSRPCGLEWNFVSDSGVWRPAGPQARQDLCKTKTFIDHDGLCHQAWREGRKSLGRTKKKWEDYLR